MRKVQRWQFLIVASAILALALILTTGAAIGVGQSAYPVQNITVSPSGSVCIGSSITVSGGGATPGATVTAVLASSSGTGFPAALLGTTTADSSGNWSVKTTAPTTGLDSTGKSVPITAGTYLLGGVDSMNSNYVAAGTLSLLDCSALPKTGEDSALPKIFAGVLMVAAGAGLIAWRRRSAIG